jgi:Ca2+-binding EF-hand superfamily protein
MKTRTFLIAMIALGLLAALPLPAQPKGAAKAGGPGRMPSAEEIFKRADTNNDGTLSLEEFKTHHDLMRQRMQERMRDRRSRAGGPAGPGQRHGAPGENLDRMKAADTNNDEQVSAEEFKAAFPNAPAEQFARMDRNNDGVLSKEDMPEPPPAAAENMPRKKGGERAALIQKADTDNDGRITPDEFKKAFPEAPADRFQKMDADNDGALTKKDLAQRKPAGPAAGKGPRGEDRGAVIRKRLQDADTNGDEKISIEEARKAFPNMPDEFFKSRDRNGDGFISREDRQKKN